MATADDDATAATKNMRNVDCDEEIIEFDRENNGNNIGSNNKSCIDSIKENDSTDDYAESSAADCGVSSTSSTSTLSSSTTTTTIESMAATTTTTVITSTVNDQCSDSSKRNAPTNTSNSKSVGSGLTKRQPSISLGQRKRLVSTSLTKTPVIDGEFTDFHDHRLVNGQDPYDMKYQLYAVVVSIVFFLLIRLVINVKGAI